jgi:hypothetical protein
MCIYFQIIYIFPLNVLFSLLKIDLPYALLLDLTLCVLHALLSRLEVILLYNVLLNMSFANLYVVFSIGKKTLFLFYFKFWIS